LIGFVYYLRPAVYTISTAVSSMKAVIIGGGIAGLSIGIYLRKAQHTSIVCERASCMSSQGHAFLMHAEGKQILDEIRNGSEVKLPGGKIETFSLRRPGGKEIKHLKLDHWKCIKRADLSVFLNALFTCDCIKYNRSFSHFLYEDKKIVAAVFDNGDVEHGDIFIGADGSQSRVRQAIFGRVDYSPVTVKEIVGTVKLDDSIVGVPATFTKYQHEAKGLAFGLIPTAPHEYVWFMQFNPEVADLPGAESGDLEVFCKEQLDIFPEVVKAVINNNDFTTSYVWNTTDFDLLPSFHHENVVLIGDAAHLALPFTSTGTTNALLDAKTLADCLKNSSSLEDAFTDYYKFRANDVSKHIHAGRQLNELFRFPQQLSDDEIPVPLIPPKPQQNQRKPLQVLYFTDPVCSTCWIIQPLLRKLHLEYGSYLDIKYCMGGLLPSWEGYNKGQIKQPSDAARHWEDVCRQHEIPLDGDIWFEDPLPSSYPPSIAFKAAQMQDTDKAILFLRRIKEMLFLEKKNIIKWEYLERAAFETGLDSARLKRDFDGKAQELFKADLELASDLGIKVFPTLIFSDGKEQLARLAGYHAYERFENIILKLLPGAVKEPIIANPYKLFTTFFSMTDKEYSVLSEVSQEEAKRQLVSLYEEGVIEKHESKNGTIWTRKLVDT
jgi:2-polyprenyl-6-methoxyphenol hydroxylase-like FAD-dependent oxidoreductase/predicted DsbA family dithiol-disulfide isomerase